MKVTPMNDISVLIEDMLVYKEHLGFSRRTYEGWMNNFSLYFKGNGLQEFSESSISQWIARRDTESNSGFRKRVTVLREFSKYLYGMGEADYIIPTTFFPMVRRYTPYIFTDQELRDLFKACDREPYSKESPCRNLIIPVIYRLIYFCGLRPNEGRELLKSDFDYDTGTLFIRKNKSHRERRIPLSNDVAQMCHKYLYKSTQIYPETDCFFPSPDGQTYGHKWLTNTFLRLWNDSKPEGNVAGVRVYDLRHRWATAVFMKWMDEGKDMYAMMPYLSAYMGHSGFKDTLYYIHLLPGNLRRSSAVDWNRFEDIIPEVEHEQ
jgi:integrase